MMLVCILFFLKIVIWLMPGVHISVGSILGRIFSFAIHFLTPFFVFVHLL